MTALSRLLALLAVSSLLFGCATMEVDHSFDPTAQFDSYKTFSVQPVAVVEWDKFNSKILGSNGVALDYAKAILQEKGYRYVENGDADFLVTARAEAVSSEQESPPAETEAPSLTFSWQPRPPPHKTDPSYRDQISRDQHLDQTNRNVRVNALHYYLVIEILDQPSQKIVWQGWARYDSLGGFKSDAHKAELVFEILARFPN